MAEDSPMGSLLAAVAVAAASSNAPTNQSSPSPPHPPGLSTPHLPTKLPPISIPPPPPPLPPPLPSPPPLPPLSIRRPHNPLPVKQPYPIPAGLAEKRKGARIFSAEEKKILEANYARNKFPSRLHMETLGNAMGKGTEKVRTWYNNRRALDRKLGVDVNRNQQCDPHSARYATNPPKEIDNAVILPTGLISSPASRADPPAQISPATPSPNYSKHSSHTRPRHTFVEVTPCSLPWTPSISPVTAARNSQVAISPSPCSSVTRFRTSPLRIRNVRIRIGCQDLYGEIPEHLSLDNGLELKFLFGKKRIVYEWYCGSDYADAQNTGGPYAKVEMNFASISAIELVQETATSNLVFSFSALPILFLQTRESMMKYRIRAQQRQYRKVGRDEFPIPVTADQHKISLRAEEAARVLKLLCEDVPGLPALSLAQGDNMQRWNIPSQVHPHISHVSPKKSEPSPPSIRAQHSVGNASPMAKRRPFTAFDLSSKQQIDGQNNAPEPREGTVDHGSSNTNHRTHTAIRSTISREAPGSKVGRDSLYSPATPMGPPRKLEKDPPWLTANASSHVLPMPPYINSITDRRGSQDGVGHVRRELDFNHISRQSVSTPLIGVGTKRSLPETSSDENEAKPKTRRKITDWEASRIALPTSAPEQSHINRTSPVEPNVPDANSSKEKEDVPSSRVLPQRSILRVLPR